MKDSITKDELIVKLTSWHALKAGAYAESTWIQSIADHIMPEFKPEVDKAYMFFDDDGGQTVSIFKRMFGDQYQCVLRSAWDNCRPLTDQEIGK